MNQKVLSYVLLSTLILFFGCEQHQSTINNLILNQSISFEKEKKSILNVLNEETKSAFNRDYEGWKEKWIQEPYVTKIYLNFADSTMTETLGWDEVNYFVKTYIEEHPEPEPLPAMLNNIDVRLYGNGAWVSFEQTSANGGLKRETRLMEKDSGQWKIAGMQTIIYEAKGRE